MANKKDPAGQFNLNEITEAIKAYGVVPASLATFVNLGTIYIYTHCLVINSLNNDTVIKFGDNEITFLASTNVVMDNFKFNGILQYKYKSSAPTAGSLQIICY